MRKIKKLSTAFFVLVLFLTLSAPAMAAAAIDTTHHVSLTISYQQDGKPIPGVPFALYRVADVNAYAEFTLSGDFKNYPVRLDGLDSAAWRALAETLAAYVQRDRLTPLDSGVTDRNGELTFLTNGKTLLPGLYLVIGQTFSDGSFVYTTEPFLICLPNLDEKTDTWQYDVTVSPKHTRTPIPVGPPDDTDKRKVLKVWNDAGQEHDRPEKITVQLLKNGEVYDTVILNERNSWRYIWNDLPKYDKNGLPIEWRVVELTPEGYTVSITQESGTFVVTNTPKQPSVTPPTDQPKEPTLPQTGELWWPVPVLAAAGLLLIAAGAGKKRKA